MRPPLAVVGLSPLPQSSLVLPSPDETPQNFNFRFFDLSKLPPSVSRSPSVTIRFWAKRRPQPSWHLFLEEEVCLDRLNFIASPIGRRLFPPNALLFHLQDGLYSLDFPSVPTEPKQGPAVATSSYSALMKLATLEGSIQDAMQTRQRIVSQIDRLLEQSPADTTDCARQEATLASKYVARQQRANRLALERRNELQLSLDRRRKAMEEGRRWQAQAEEDVADNRPKLEAAKKLLRETEYRIRGQRRRICSDLSNIFPIVPMLEAPPLSFRICNLPLPNSAYDGSTARAINEDALSAALGLATLLTHHLQFYLSRPLPYPLHPHGSRSFARDEISLLPDGVAPRTRREFPLYLPRGGSAVGHWRFEYGWFLLNKDIEALCASQGLRLVDIRHSLPNLKYLLYVCSAGSDELPQRKKGGVRGLWAGRLEAETPTETGSRSDGRTPSPAPPPPATTRTDGLAGDPSSDPSPPLRLSWAGGQTDFTLRTKGLRENTAP